MTNIKNVRKSKGVTQRELAERLGITRQAVQQMESNDSVTLSTLEKIARALNCSVSELIAIPDEEKKSTPEGAPLTQFNGTTSGEKSEAERLFDKIGTGAYYAVRRPKNPRVDRQLRRMIADANMNGDCIINDGSGYFRPGEEDDVAFEAYCAAERHRGWEILHKVNRMEETFERRYQ